MTKRLVVACLLLILSLLCWADEASDLRKAIQAADQVAQAAQAVKTHRDYLGPELANKADDWLEQDQKAENAKVSASRRTELMGLVATAEAAHRPLVGAVKEPKQTALEVLNREGFRDPGKTTSKNWAAHGLDKVWNAFWAWLRSLMPKVNTPNMPSMPFLEFLPRLIWSVIILAVLAFLGLAIWQFTFVRLGRRVKTAGGLMEADEPDRTADEWLQKADELEWLGEFRLAVRCLYVACLIRLDEANVARFRRGETNWEHLRRIENSPRRPAGFDFRPPTQKFDLVWYGHQVEGASDVQLFRDWYRATMSAVGRRVA